MVDEELLDPETLLSRAFAANINNFMKVKTFRQVAALGAPLAEFQVLQESMNSAYSLLNDEQYNDLFIDKEKAKEAFGGHEKWGKQIADTKMEQFALAVDSASVVFCHSILDALSFDYCRVTSLVSPESWEEFVIRKKISVEEARDFTYEEILKSKILSAISMLERESLLKKVDRLFAICKPPQGFSPIRDYNYDRDRIVAFDKARHEVVHGEVVKDALPVSDDDIWYYMSTANYFMGLVNNKFDLRIDPHKMIGAFGGS